MASRGTIILSTFPSEESAADVANKVVGDRLCACVNFAKVRSIYAWRGKLEDQQEFIALFKTTVKSAKKLKAEIASQHPYNVPEIVELKMDDVSKSYLSWLVESTDGVPKKRHNAAK
ncbi:MAG TPA: divalent-cation tolerance protein CutA [Nitrososphaera sp.]|nr:divalent-cation tolerance protein CutA [Nitrososphaera sp.]